MKNRVKIKRNSNNVPEENCLVRVGSTHGQVRVRVPVQVHGARQREAEPADILTHSRPKDHLQQYDIAFLYYINRSLAFGTDNYPNPKS